MERPNPEDDDDLLADEIQEALIGTIAECRGHVAAMVVDIAKIKQSLCQGRLV